MLLQWERELSVFLTIMPQSVNVKYETHMHHTLTGTLSTKCFCKKRFNKTKNSDSTADTCKNCAKCGKGFKIGTNEAYNIKIKIGLGSISKLFCFCSHANMAASDKGISLKKKFFKKFLLNITN